MDDTLRAVTDIAYQHLAADDAIYLKDPEASLSEAGFGSLELVRFLVDLEKKLGIEFPADLINDQTFRNLCSVANAVRALRGR
ncbi:MAG: phosphopantetheine-binding protein [Egibacteraceae bacterium]